MPAGLIAGATSVGCLLTLCLSLPRLCLGQEAAKPPRDSTHETGIAAGESAAEPPARRLVRWNEYDGKLFTLRLGAAVLFDYATFAQDDASEQQVTMDPTFKIRDSRFLIVGRLKTKRRITYQAGLMYDGNLDDWFVRQTGVMIGVPELWGHLWIGRSKEGVSLNRVMVGYSGWTMERFTYSDAAIPLLADGIKWLGYLPNRHFIWNLGVFVNWLSEGESFSYYDHQVAARLMWVPMEADSSGTLLHLGVSLFAGVPENDSLRLRSKPEVSGGPYVIDTGKLPASSSRQFAMEAYYRPGRWLFGAEYILQWVTSPQTSDPMFHGGDAFVSLLLTGETRSYNTVGGYFRAVSPKRTVFEGGPGAWEAVLRVSYSDLHAGTLNGGTFWRITPMINWHMSDNARFEFAYGYGVLDRFDMTGATHFFQTRLQLQL